MAMTVCRRSLSRVFSFMKGAERIGFSLREISGLLSLRVDPRSTCDDVRGGQRLKAWGLLKRKWRPWKE
ncbi:MAG: MerR family DNA-binding protein [Proteobacteria bacterium]|nr:MerR family DNA-binding protein [Pseudomonadota bacterium]NIS67863.1 MerR family DNA-binding protein [Pseudomonadota bacterium]